MTDLYHDQYPPTGAPDTTSGTAHPPAGPMIDSQLAHHGVNAEYGCWARGMIAVPARGISCPSDKGCRRPTRTAR